MKTCHKCKIEKEDLEFSKSQLKSKYGQCKTCMREYYISNKEHKLEYQKNYRQENRNEISKYKNAYWQENKEELYEYKKEWRQEYSSVLKHCDIHDKDYYSEECPACSGIRNKNYKNEHKEEIREQQKLYRQENKEELNEYYKNRRENDPIYNLRRVVSVSIYAMLKSQSSSKNGSSILDFLPYTIQELKAHLEKQFEFWMTWDNQGTYNRETWDDNDPTTWAWQLDHIIPHSTFNYTSMEDEEFKKCWALENLRPLSAKQNLLDGANRTRHIMKNPKCTTCNDIREIDFDLGRPAWPNEPGTAPNLIIRVPCPDCVPCTQCAHPNYDGVHTCRKFQP